MKTNQAGMECWPRARYAGSAPSKISVTKGPNLGATLKRKIHFEDLAVVGKSSDKQPDKEIIPAATYESALDMDKEDSVESSEDSDNFANQVKEMLGDENSPPKDNNSQLVASCLLESEVEVINQALFQEASAKSVGKIPEIQ